MNNYIYRWTIKLVVAGLFVALVTYLNIKFLWPYLIPDDCYYHTHKPGFLVSMLFDFPASENGHSVPSIFNIVLTFVVGLLLGNFVSEKMTSGLLKREWQKQ